MELEDEIDKLFLDLLIALASDILVLAKQAERVYRLPIHCALSVLARGLRVKSKVRRGRRVLQRYALALMQAIKGSLDPENLA